MSFPETLDPPETSDIRIPQNSPRIFVKNKSSS